MTIAASCMYPVHHALHVFSRPFLPLLRSVPRLRCFFLMQLMMLLLVMMTMMVILLLLMLILLLHLMSGYQ